MAWEQRPPSPLSQVSDAHDSGMTSFLLSVNKSIRWQCEEDFHFAEILYVFLTFILMVVAFSALFYNRINIIDENYGPRNQPGVVLQFDSFSVIDFRVMEKQLAANWTAKFIFINKKNDIEISIEPFDLFVFYKRTNLVSCASVGETLVLKTNYEAVMEVELSPKHCNEGLSINDEVLQQIDKDLRNGKIGLNLNLGSIWGCYLVKLEPGCALDLEFNSTKLSAEPRTGTLAKGCRIPFPA